MRTIILFYSFLVMNCLIAQDLADQVNPDAAIPGELEIFTEKINNIGRSQKIFILTNSNSLLNKGDFVTLLIDGNKAVARALVAKGHRDLVGMKIMKIYSLANWTKVHQGMDIKVLKGDDSILFRKTQEISENEDTAAPNIKSEEDLYAEELALEDSFDDTLSTDGRIIKPDNLISAAAWTYTFEDSSTGGDEVGGYELTGGWAYQVKDNYWVEGLLTYLSINNYPDTQDNTVITRATFRLKYTIQLPFYSYIMPYAGYQLNLVSSPNATSTVEQDNVSNLAQNEFALGATFMRRLVPGWFLKIDLGLDMFNVGAAIEF